MVRVRDSPDVQDTMVALQLDNTMNGVTYYDVTDTDTDYVVYTCGDVNDASDFSEHLKGIGYKTVVVVRNTEKKIDDLIAMWREVRDS